MGSQDTCVSTIVWSHQLATSVVIEIFLGLSPTILGGQIVTEVGKVGERVGKMWYLMLVYVCMNGN